MQRAAGEDADQVTPELGGAALVADRLRGLDGEIGRALDQLRRDRLAFERRLGRGGPHAATGATAASAIRALAHTSVRPCVSCEATPTTAMSSSRRGVWRM